MSNLHIAVLMMVKNEKKRLHVTLESIKNFAKSLVLYDTGSEDNTIKIAKNFCQKNNINFRLKKGEFVNFAVSRNVSLDFADTFLDIDYLLLLDTNDEVKNSKELEKFCQEYKNKENTGFLVCQEWWSGRYDKYYNLRLIKAREGWRYRGAVHEWLKNTKYEKDEDAPIQIKLPDTIVLFQDRTKDDDKSSKRFHRDKVLLFEEYKNNPTNPRTVFYLAQTFSCLNENENSYYYYKIRTTLDGFLEEKFHAMLKCAEFSKKLGHPWKIQRSWYMNALELFDRAEPAIEIAKYYNEKENFFLSYTFCSMACKLQFPNNSLLFVDRYCYDYYRWHLLGIVAYWAGFYEEGKIGCLKALEVSSKKEINNTYFEVDNKNLKFYIDKENINIKNKLTKNEFIKLKSKEIKQINPSLNRKQVLSKAKKLWKDK